MQLNTRFQDLNKLDVLCLADSAKFSKFSTKIPEDELTAIKNALKN